MGFVSVDKYNEDHYRYMFRVAEDGESTDVIFLYQSSADMLKADVHYIKSHEYSGYVHCLGKNCPACKKNFRLQTKLFIPIYNIYKEDPETHQQGVIQFWDRNYSEGFNQMFRKDVFDKTPNPSEYVYTIHRTGGYRDQSTRYTFVPAGRNAIMSYSQILAKFNATMPDYYDNIVRNYDESKLAELVSHGSDDNSTNSNAINQDYIPIPRAGYQSSIPNTYVNASDAVGTSTDVASTNDAILSEFDDDDGELPTPTF